MRAAKPTRRHRLFFATRGDLRPGIERIESGRALEYQLNELRDDRNFVIFASLLDAPMLGTSTTGAMMTDYHYLVYARGSRPRTRDVLQMDGGMKYAQELSSEMLILQPGGVHQSGAIVAGRVGPTQAAAASDRGLALYDEFSRTLLHGFRRIHSYWVGSEAYRALHAGARLATIGITSPAAYDIADPESHR